MHEYKTFTSILLFMILISQPERISFESPRAQWIVWNVGQGLWITHIKNDYCWHFDFGGERNPIKEVIPHCQWRKNILSLSHADRDHYSFIKSIRKNLNNLCLWGPSWKTLPTFKVGAQAIPQCQSIPLEMLSFYNPTQKKSHHKNPRSQSKGRNELNKNEMSQMVLNSHWLLPGDAPQTSEKNWLDSSFSDSTSRKAIPITDIRRLVLGHHGSKTSSSVELLSSLPNLIQCIASARFKKYGHPHSEVRTRVKNFCSLILTEDWNHIHFFE